MRTAIKKNMKLMIAKCFGFFRLLSIFVRYSLITTFAMTCSNTIKAEIYVQEMIHNGSILPLTEDGDPLVFWQVPLSWWKSPRNYILLENKSLKLFTPSGRNSAFLRYRLIPKQPESEYCFLIGASKNHSGKAYCRFSVYDCDKNFLKNLYDFEFESENKEIKKNLIIPDNISGVPVSFLDFSFSVIGIGAELSIESLSLKPLPSSKKIGLGKVILDGVPCKSIVISNKDPSASYFDIKAALLLREYFFKICGELLPIEYNINAIKEKEGHLYIGSAATEYNIIEKRAIYELSDGSYFVFCRNGIAAVTGKDGPGVISGAWYLIKNLGVKYYSFSDIVIPEKEYLAVQAMEIKKRPTLSFALCKTPWWWYRDYAPFGFADCDIMADPRKVGLNSDYLHTSNLQINYNNYHKEHPEYFAMDSNGKRLAIEDGNKRYDIHLCLSNPQVRRIAKENILKWMSLQPYAKYFALAPGDGVTRGFCCCPECRKLDKDQNDYSNRMLNYVNEITEQVSRIHPDKKLIHIAYTPKLERTPSETKPSENVLCFYCLYGMNWKCQLHAFCEENQKGMVILKEWTTKYPRQTVLFLYPRNYVEPLTVFNTFYATIDATRYALKNDLKGICLCDSPTNFKSLQLSVMGKLFWNPEIDIEKEIDSFMEEYYGVAAPFMRKYFNSIYRLMGEKSFHQDCETRNLSFVDSEFLLESYELFNRAEMVAGENFRLQKRISLEKVFLLWSDLNSIINADAPVNLKKLAEFTKLAKEHKIRSFLRDQDVQRYFFEKIQIKINSKLWYDDPVIEKIIQEPENAVNTGFFITQKEIINGFELPIKYCIGGIPCNSYSYMCEVRSEVSGIRRPDLKDGNSRIKTNLYLKDAPGDNYILKLEGQDDDKPGQAVFAIKINDKIIFEGKNQFVEKGWSTVCYEIPQNTLKKGKNQIEFINMTQNTTFPNAEKKDSHWGWILISRVEIIKK